MLVDITASAVAILESVGFEFASKTVYHRPACVPTGRYFIDSSTPVKTVEEVIAALADRRKSSLYPYLFITDCMSHYVADSSVGPMPVPMSEDGHIVISGKDAIVRVRSSNLRLALNKVAKVSQHFDAAIIQNVRGAQALRLSAKAVESEIVTWVATQDSLSEWIP